MPANSASQDTLIDAAVRRWRSLPFGQNPRDAVSAAESTAGVGFYGTRPAHTADFHAAAAVLAGSKGDAVVSPDFFAAHPVGRRLQARLLAAGHTVRPVTGGVAVVAGSPVRTQPKAVYAKPKEPSRSYPDLVLHAARVLDDPLDNAAMQALADHLAEVHPEDPAVVAFVHWVSKPGTPLPADARQLFRNSRFGVYTRNERNGLPRGVLAIEPGTPATHDTHGFRKSAGEKGKWTVTTPAADPGDFYVPTKQKVDSREAAQHVYDKGGVDSLIHTVLGLRMFHPRHEGGPYVAGSGSEHVVFARRPSQYARRLPDYHPKHLSLFSVANPDYATDTVRALAKQMYGSTAEEDTAADRERMKAAGASLERGDGVEEVVPAEFRYAPSGHRLRARDEDYSVGPILADALQDAGVQDDDFLSRLRGVGDSIVDTRMPLGDHEYDSKWGPAAVVRSLAYDTPEQLRKKFADSLPRQRERLKKDAEDEAHRKAHAAVVGKNSTLPLGYIVHRDGGGDSGMRGNPPPGDIWSKPAYRSGQWFHRAQKKQGRPLTTKELKAILAARREAKRQSKSPEPPPSKYAAAREAHPLVAGFRIEHALRHLTTDPKASENTKRLAAAVLYDGDTSALVPLHDSLREDGHPFVNQHNTEHDNYRWQRAVHGLHVDDAVGRAINAVGSRIRGDVRDEEPVTGGVGHEAISLLRGALAAPDGFPARRDGDYAAADEAVAELRGPKGEDGNNSRIDDAGLAKSLTRHSQRLWDRGDRLYRPERTAQIVAAGISGRATPWDTADDVEASRYARRSVRRPVHELVRGTRLSLFLKELARHPDAAVAATAKSVLRDGDLTALGALADRLDDIDDPHAGGGDRPPSYSLRDAQRRLLVDRAVHGHLQERAEATYPGEGNAIVRPHNVIANAVRGVGAVDRLAKVYAAPATVPPVDIDHGLVAGAAAAVRDVSFKEIEGSLRRAHLKAADYAARNVATDAYRQSDRYRDVARRIGRAAVSPEPVPSDTHVPTLRDAETPENLAAGRFRYRRDPVADAFNAEFAKAADRLHAKHGVGDLDRFKATDVFGKLAAATGSPDRAADAATHLLYDGTLERRHRAGQPLLPLVTVAGRFANRDEAGRRHRQLGGGTFTDALDPDSPPPDVTADRSFFATDALPPKSANAAAKADYRDRIRRSGDDAVGRRLAELVSRRPGLPVSQVAREFGLTVGRVRRAAEAAGVVVGTLRSKTHTRALLYPPGATPPTDPKDERYRAVLAAADARKPHAEIAAENGMTRKQVTSLVQRLRKGLRSAAAAKYARVAASDFVAALRRVRSRQQQVLRELAESIAKKLKLSPAQTRDAVYDDGRVAVPHVAVATTRGDRDRVRVAGAWLGLQSQAPSLAVFHADDEGGDFLHSVTVGGSGDRVRATLDRFGLRKRMLLPTRDGWTVLVYDAGQQLKTQMEAFARSVGSPLKTVAGEGEVIGGGSGPAADEKSRRNYRGIITAAERKKREWQSGSVQPGNADGPSFRTRTGAAYAPAAAAPAANPALAV